MPRFPGSNSPGCTTAGTSPGARCGAGGQTDLEEGSRLTEVEIYTDGACLGNPGPGGWAAILRFGGHEKELSGFEPATTNQRMELTAALRALQALKYPCRVRLHSDSAYLINAFRQDWLGRWERNGWINVRKEPVENQDLWRELLRQSRIHRIEWVKVRGHADDETNERCDALARAAIRAALDHPV